jgi:hypothetical protein
VSFVAARRHGIRLWVALAAAAGVASADESGLVDTSRSPHAVMRMVGLDDVRWTGGLLGERFAACRDSMIPYLWTVLRDPQESHAWDNFLMAAGRGEGRGDGRPHGPPFNDGDFLKWLEAVIQAEAISPAETRAAAAARAASRPAPRPCPSSSPRRPPVSRAMQSRSRRASRQTRATGPLRAC